MAQGIPTERLSVTSHAHHSLAVQPPLGDDLWDYPTRYIRAEFERSTVVFGNLECPLSERGRRIRNDMCYRASPKFAPALKKSGFSVLSFSNNHCFDFGEEAFIDTIDALDAAAIICVGAFKRKGAAERSRIVTQNETRFGFLAYNGIGPDVAYAAIDESGTIPLNRMEVLDDIQAARNRVDVLVLSLHWGNEDAALPCPEQEALAREFIDQGADIVLGHGSHVPGRLELHKGKPIVYSLGNCIFGHGHKNWSANLLYHFTIRRGSIRHVEIVPLDTAADAVFQPKVLHGEKAGIILGRLVRRALNVNDYELRDGRLMLDI